MAREGEVRTIVVGYDGSDPSRRAISHVARFAPEPRTVVVVAVVPEVRASSISDEPLAGGDFDAERLLGEAAELLSGTEGTTIDRRATTGDPAVVLVDVTREVGADPLIVGRRGTDFVTRTLLLSSSAPVGTLCAPESAYGSWAGRVLGWAVATHPSP